jgi:rod shape determining protein RodA
MISEYNISQRSNTRSLFGNVDRVALGIYIVIVLIGVLSITSASFDSETTNVFAFSHNYMKQLMWVGISWTMAAVVLLLDRRLFHMFAYPAYIFGLLLLLCTLVFGREVNGAKAWFELGGIRVQPVEFVKIATSLMMARIMSDYSFNIRRFTDLVKIGVVILLPFGIIVMQNDTGSGLVLGAFLFVMYREGLSKYIYFPIIFTIVLFIAALILQPVVIFLALLVAFTLYSILVSGELVGHLRFFFGAIFVWLLLSTLTPLSGYVSLMIVCGVAVVVLAALAIKTRTKQLLWTIFMFFYAMCFVPTADTLFQHLEPHQKNRILTFVGLVDDPRNVGYNLNQSKIAIGSGGMWGKGFMEGTQIKYDYVPEKHTDFIFCIVGEEWGFFGSAIVVVLYISLILRLMKMGERIKEPFGRVYCYSVASIILVHVIVNMGMTIGLMPVMGIPLPLMSYGGSSLVAFTLLIMIAIRLDASTSDGDMYV